VFGRVEIEKRESRKRDSEVTLFDREEK